MASPAQSFIDLVSSCYPGRASMTPVLDLFITLLAMGESGYRSLLEERKRMRTVLLAGLAELTATHGLSLLSAPHNSISTGVSLDALITEQQQSNHELQSEHGKQSVEQSEEVGQQQRQRRQEGLTYLGSMLYQRSVSGCRVVACTGEVKKVAGVDFVDWGAHAANYRRSYFTVACSFGITEQDVMLFLQRLHKVLTKFKKVYPVGEPDTTNSAPPLRKET